MSTATENIIPGYEIGNHNVYPIGDRVIRRIDLEYKGGGSDKVYICILSQESHSNEIHVQAFYGRRNSRTTPSHIYSGLSEAEAVDKLENTSNSKMRKGYRLVGTQQVNKASSVSNHQLYEERILFPMNAQPLKEGKKKQEILESNEWIAEEKEDGVRMTVHVTPTGLRMFSRSAGKDDPLRPLEKTHAFAHLKDVVFPEKYIGTIFDTEAMAPGMDSATIAGHINALDGRDNGVFYFKVFDLIQEGSIDIAPLDWKFRRMKLTQMFEELQLVGLRSKNGILLVDNVDYFSAGMLQLSKYTIREKEEFHYDIIARGGEGTMWKNISSKYREGARPANTWYKWKKQDTADVVICGFTAGKGKYENQIGAVKYAEFLTEDEILELGIKKKHHEHMFKDGKDYYLVEIGQCSGMTDEQRLDFTNNQGSYLNRVIEVEYMERTKKGALRHPRFLQLRDEKSTQDCIYSNQS